MKTYAELLRAIIRLFQTEPRETLQALQAAITANTNGPTTQAILSDFLTAIDLDNVPDSVPESRIQDYQKGKAFMEDKMDPDEFDAWWEAGPWSDPTPPESP